MGFDGEGGDDGSWAAIPEKPHVYRKSALEAPFALELTGSTVSNQKHSGGGNCGWE